MLTTLWVATTLSLSFGVAVSYSVNTSSSSNWGGDYNGLRSPYIVIRI
ncbi:hypothetical protein [Nostoc sp. NIES-3756]|nr:hypothetical protein [Nostoc sp. NIES-3756]